MYSFSIREFIWEHIGDFYDSWMFGPNFIPMLLMFGGEGGVINTMLTLNDKHDDSHVKHRDFPWLRQKSPQAAPENPCRRGSCPRCNSFHGLDGHDSGTVLLEVPAIYFRPTLW